jgi:hypothetical protein
MVSRKPVARHQQLRLPRRERASALTSAVSAPLKLSRTLTGVVSMASRPASDFDPDLLLEIVEEIARAVRPVDPERVAQRPWDQGRARSTRFPDAPPARRIAETLGLSWPEVVRVALLPPGTRERTLGRQLGEDNQDWLTEDYIAHVLRLVASNLDVRTLTPAQYHAERSRLLAADASRWRHVGQLCLPNEHQLATAAGGWHRALRLAGLSGGQGRGVCAA